MWGVGQLKVKLASNVNKRFILEQRPYFVGLPLLTSTPTELVPRACSLQGLALGVQGMWAMGPPHWVLKGCREAIACPPTIRLYNPVLQVGKWPNYPSPTVNSSVKYHAGLLLFACSKR